jgi:hypothetical protein
MLDGMHDPGSTLWLGGTLAALVALAAAVVVMRAYRPGHARRHLGWDDLDHHLANGMMDIDAYERRRVEARDHRD